MQKFGIFAMTMGMLAGIAADVRGQGAGGPREAVDQFFLGMRMANESILRAALAPDVRFAVLDASADSATTAAQSMDGFIRSVVVSGGAWNEQIYEVETRVDDTVASVWAPYTFYVQGRISHCGVNSIELLRGAEGWKITQISDTRRTVGCPDPLGG
jgi:hypothetical protein